MALTHAEVDASSSGPLAVIPVSSPALDVGASGLESRVWTVREGDDGAASAEEGADKLAATSLVHKPFASTPQMSTKIDVSAGWQPVGRKEYKYSQFLVGGMCQKWQIVSCSLTYEFRKVAFEILLLPSRVYHNRFRSLCSFSLLNSEFRANALYANSPPDLAGP